MSIFRKQSVTAERIGRNIHDLRLSLGMSRNTLSEKTRLQREYIKQLEYGFSEPTKDEMKRVSKALNISSADLLSEDSLVIELDGMNIRTLRKAVGEKQGALASAMNVSIRTIGDWELGKRPVPRNMAREISEHFNVPLDALLSGDIDEYIDNNKAEELYDLAKSATNDEIDYVAGMLRYEMSKRGR